MGPEIYKHSSFKPHWFQLSFQHLCCQRKQISWNHWRIKARLQMCHLPIIIITSSSQILILKKSFFWWNRRISVEMLFLFMFKAEFTWSRKAHGLLLYVTAWACKGTTTSLKQTLFCANLTYMKHFPSGAPVCSLITLTDTWNFTVLVVYKQKELTANTLWSGK